MLAYSGILYTKINAICCIQIIQQNITELLKKLLTHVLSLSFENIIPYLKFDMNLDSVKGKKKRKLKSLL